MTRPTRIATGISMTTTGVLFKNALMKVVGASLLFRFEPHGPMLEKLTRMFSDAAAVAKGYGIKLAVENHIDFNPEEMLSLITNVHSPYLGMNFDTGNTFIAGQDPVAFCERFKDRINHVHYRNIRVDTPYFKYTEVFHDEGDCDMLACMKAFHEVNYQWLLIPDHTPAFSGDTKGNQMGWAWALGYLSALRHTAES